MLAHHCRGRAEHSTVAESRYWFRVLVVGNAGFFFYILCISAYCAYVMWICQDSVTISATQLLPITVSEADLGLLQHPRWSTL